MNYFRLMVSGLLFFIALISCKNTTSTEKKRPNVIIVMADDQGWGDLSVHSNPYLETPFIDAFKTQSASLERFFVSPVCAPTRASLLSGQWAIRTGAWGVTNRDEVMRSETRTLAEIFSEAGYKTGIFGKWHNGAQYPENPKGQGFHTFLGFTAGHWNNYFDTTLKDINDTPVKTKGYITDVFTDAAIRFMQQHKNKPFLCYIPYNAPHSPFQVPDAYFNKYKARGLNDKDACVYGMCENIDANFGKILKVLEEEGLAENTIVIFMSDNGPNGKRYNGKMKGIKATNDEGGTRIPFFIRWPENIAAGKTIEGIAAHIDVLPTVLSLCEIPVEATLVFDGKDLAPQLLGNAAETGDRTLFSHWSGLSWEDVPGSVRNNRYRLVLKREDTTLHDMKNDPWQQNDLFDALPEVASEMLLHYRQWIAEVYAEGPKRTPIRIGYDAAPVTLIEAHEFALSEGLAYFGKQGWANDWVSGWNAVNDTISVPITVQKEGIYDFELLYNCPESQLGSEIILQVQEKTLKSTVRVAFPGETLQSPDRIPRKEVYERTWGVLPLGKLTLNPGSEMLKLHAGSVAKDSVMHVKGIRITLQK